MYIPTTVGNIFIVESGKLGLNEKNIDRQKNTL